MPVAYQGCPSKGELSTSGYRGEGHVAGQHDLQVHFKLDMCSIVLVCLT